MPLSYDVKIWGITPHVSKKEPKKGQKPKTTYELRWRVANHRCSKTYDTIDMAKSVRSELVTALNNGQPFDVSEGFPESMLRRQRSKVTYFALAIEYMREVKWPHLEAGSRGTFASSLATVTAGLTDTRTGAPTQKELHRALVKWAFNKRAQTAGDPPAEHAAAIDWIKEHSLPVSDLAEPKVARQAFNLMSINPETGKPFASDTYQNKRKAFNGVVKFAIERKILGSHPLDGLELPQTVNRHDDVVDPRVVVNPTQARTLLKAVRDHGVRKSAVMGPRLVAFFALLYFAGLRPSEALALRPMDCTLPDEGWGLLRFAEATPYVTGEWTDDGEAQPRKPLKHRAKGVSRDVPACPELVRILRRHIKQYNIAPADIMFVSSTGKAVTYGTFANIWQKARRLALSEAEFESPLAEDPYSLRHAALSTWLNNGVPPAEVAKRAGHTIEMLFRTYAKCVVGQEDLANQRIEAALGEPDPDL